MGASESKYKRESFVAEKRFSIEDWDFSKVRMCQPNDTFERSIYSTEKHGLGHTIPLCQDIRTVPTSRTKLTLLEDHMRDGFRMAHDIGWTAYKVECGRLYTWLMEDPHRGNLKDVRLSNMLGELESRGEIYAPVMYIQPFNGKLEFGDGRHRTAAIHMMGATEIIIMLPDHPQAASIAQEQFGLIGKP